MARGPVETMNCTVAIGGAGHGGAQSAISLRQRKFEGSIAATGDEPGFPYERPPLSKEYLAEDNPFEASMFRPEKFRDERDAMMILSTRGMAVHTDRKIILTDGDHEIGYLKLFRATGAIPREPPLSGFDLDGIHYVRPRADVDGMIAMRDADPDTILVGGGYIGSEATAVLRKPGKIVIMLEALDSVPARTAGEPLSRFYKAEHASQGVQILLERNIAGAYGKAGKVAGERLPDGTEILAQMVIVGMGVELALQPPIDLGAEGENGVKDYVQGKNLIESRTEISPDKRKAATALKALLT